MGIPPRDNGNPAMLQLRRWDLSQLPFDLSDYSEGFISPTRELLLLLSSHRDAMLLPLTGGCFDSFDVEDSRREDVQSSDSSPSSMPSTSGSLENPVSEPRSTVSCGAYSGESSASKSSSCRFLSDVHSLAWGTYGDTNRHSKEATFREFLFVSGSHGVTVHAFRQLDEISDEVSVSPAKVVDSDVRWVEWGPSGDPTNIEVPEGFVNSGWVGEDRGMYGSGDEICDGFSRKRKSVKWLRSVLTSVENRKHEDALWTFFPENLSFSCSAMVVSFHIFSNDSTFLGFLACGNSEICERVGKGKVCKPVNGSCTAADRNIESFDTVGMSQGFQCLKLFSSNSGNLVGFVLAQANAASDADQSIADRGLGKIILVSSLGVSGLQWLCSVKLDYEEVATVCEWADFQFSHNLLVCLNVTGTVSFYDALVGEYIACLNVLEIYGLKREPPLNERGHLSQIDTSKDEKGAAEIFPSESGGNVCRKDFQRLLVSSDTSLLAVVDQHSAVYIICASDHVPQKYCSYQRFSSKIFRAGELFPWTVCDSDISCQRVIVENSFGNPNIGSKRISLVNDHEDYQLNAATCWYIQGKVHQNDSNWSRMVEIPQETTRRFRQSRLLRKILLPTTRASADNIMCFSQCGITRLTRKICTNDRKDLYISHTNLQIGATTQDDGFICSGQDVYSQHEREILIEKAVGCIFQGCFYLVTTSGLQVFLPSVSVSSDIHPIEAIAYPSAKRSPLTAYDAGELMNVKYRQQVLPPWKVEALDRVLLFEGPDVADHFCLENGLDLHASRLRRLQVALGYMILDAVEQSLEELANIDMAEEGMLRLILAAVFMMADKGGNESEVSSASRLFAVASHFATKMVRKYAILAHEMNGLEAKMEMTESDELPLIPCTKLDHKAYARRLHEMSRLLVVTRNLQCRLAAKFRRSVKRSVYDVELSESQENSRAIHDSLLSLDASNSSLTEKLNVHEVDSDKSDMSYVTSEKLVLNASESADVVNLSNSVVEGTALVARSVPRRQILPAENPRETIERWKVDNMDLKNVVEDALLSGRLPLAVLQLHLHRSKQSVNDSDPNDTFNEVRSVGRAIAYDLFLKGETGLAMTTLQKLGEDVETCLRQLLFGTVNRLLKKQITEEMKKYGYLRSYELALLDKISLIERIYPSSNFWRTYNWRRRQIGDLKSIDSLVRSSLRLLHPHSLRNLIIECGEVDGVVLGSWTHLNGTPLSSEEEDPSDAGYWASAAVWSNAWDQNTFDRVLLDQPFVMGIHVMWESQLEYYLCHNDWEEVFKLLEMIPSSMTPVHSIHIVLDGLRSSTYGGYVDYPAYGGYICSPDELDAVYIDIPNIHIFQSSAHSISSTWMRMLIDKELAKRFIFLKEYWDGTEDILSLMARSGFIFEKNKKVFQRESHYWLDLDFIDLDRDFQQDTVQGFHKLVILHCSQYNLPFLMDLYLDQHKLALDDESLNLLLDSAGDCEWAKWLLLSRVKGHEYDASFSNARTIMSRGSGPANNISHVGARDIIQTVDDIAENGMLMASLATMMFAPLPLQSCLSSGIVKKSFGSSAQCTLENLRPALLGFPTLWRMLVSVCLGNDTTYELWGPKLRTVVGSSALSVYLHWRDSIFYSCGRDSSLLQMLPCWFPRPLRRLIQLYVQGPIGWQATGDLSVGDVYMQRDIGYVINNGQYSEISALSWEAAIQKQIQQELFASSAEETGLGLEHHLLRGHALAAMNYLLGCRVQRLKSENSGGVQSSAPSRAPLNIQMDVQTLFAPLTHTEESLLSVVLPLAISNYQNSMLVASCAFLLELCGLSAARLRVDTAALRRISYFYKFDKKTGLQKQVLSEDTMQPPCPEDGATADSLAQALANNYMQHDISSIITLEGSRDYSLKHLSHAVLHVLHHLEKASLPELADGMTYGSWLLSGNGDGSNIRSRQKAASLQWNLVTAFCQMHQIPLSTKYLALLARDNDWVGFLSEAQIGGYPFEMVIHVAMREFKDARLQTHILSVLRAMQSKKKATVSPSNDVEDKNNTFIPIPGFGGRVELFGILAECEKQKQPGKVLLHKAKRLQWSMLAIVASCFPDASPLHCLAVWLEITALRDASTVKAEDITSQIANSVGAAVEAANSLPASDRVANVKYNPKRVKRQRLLDSFSVNSASPSSDYISAQVAMKGMKNTKFKEAKEELFDSDQWPVSLPKMLSVLCEQQQFLPLLRGFEMFIPSCSFLSFIRALQAFSQMRLSEASAHLGSFSARIKEEPLLLISSSGLEGLVGVSWISSTARKAADAVLSNCPSPYEKRCLLQLLASTDFSDGGSLATYYRQQYWKINLAEPSLRKNENLQLGDETLDDASLLTALVKNGHWEQARNWARQLEASGGPWKFAVHHVTESQAESMVAEWKEFLWDVAEERVALWGHCQTLFIRYAFPALQAGLFFLKHAEAIEKDLPAEELHALLLLSLQWLSGMISQSNPVCPMHLLREIETRIWLLAVKSEAPVKSEREINMSGSSQDQMRVKSSSIIDQTATLITKMDAHINRSKNGTLEKTDVKENSSHVWDDGTSIGTCGFKPKRRAKAHGYAKRSIVGTADKITDLEECPSSPGNLRSELLDENLGSEISFSKWEERIGPAELERAVLSLLEFGQISASKQLQHKLSPDSIPLEFKLIDAALVLAELATPSHCVSVSLLNDNIQSVLQSYNLMMVDDGDDDDDDNDDDDSDEDNFDAFQVLQNLAAVVPDGNGHGLCKRIIAVVKAANVLEISFSEAFEKKPTELLQLLSLKAQDSFEEARLLVQTHSMPTTTVAQILAESFLKGLLAAHRGGYIDSQKEEGPAPLLWRFSDFLKWAELCPSESEVGHALMRLVITGQEIPPACEVELLILSHHFYKSSACLDGVDVLVALAATRVDTYVSEGDFSCLARLVTGVGNFHALNFIISILIENGQLDLLLQKYSSATTAHAATVEAGFRMAVLTALQRFNPNDLDAFAMVYNHFDMKHESAALLLSRAARSARMWLGFKHKNYTGYLLESMRYYIEAAEVFSSIDAGEKTRSSCAQASLVSLQIRMPDITWLDLPDTQARRALANQYQFQEALILAEAYNLNHPAEWVPVLWERMLKPEPIDYFVAEFVAVLPLHASMLLELARFYKNEMLARRDQSQFSVWLAGGLPADWAKHLERAFRCLINRTRDLRLRMQLGVQASGFSDVIDACNKEMDKVPENAGPLVLRKGHGGAYLPLM